MFGPPSPLRAATRKPTAVYQFLLEGREEAGATVRCFMSRLAGTEALFPEMESTIS
jgi:hypothetical protein